MTDCDAELADAGATYVFAVCRDPGLPAVDGLSGVAAHGAPVRALSLGSLTGIVQTVRARDFTDEAWQARLADPPELERYARAHHDVVSAVAARCPTVPLPMATVYHGDDRARDALSRELARFSTALERTAHHAEWGVKVYAPPQSDATPARPPDLSGLPRGPARRQARASPTWNASEEPRNSANGTRKRRCVRRSRWMNRSATSQPRPADCGPSPPPKAGRRSSTRPTSSRKTAPMSSLC